MKLTLSFVSCLLAAITLNAQTIFVKADASGINNGLSWANAFTSLDAALLSAAPGQEIWVAAGTYKPSSAVANNSFILPAGAAIYGGFAGTETSLSQRVLSIANETILSGDLAGNDIAGNFTTNRTDNSTHVLVVVEVVANQRAIVDGFTIKGGQTLTGSANTDLNRRGGGIIAQAKLTVRNCTFTDNYADSGAGIATIDALGSGVIVDNCIFENNEVLSQAAGLLIRNSTAADINRCIFRNNRTFRGALYPVSSSNVKIDSCIFDGNVGLPDNFGGAMFSWQSSWDMTNCVFVRNKSRNGACMYIDNREGGDVVNITNCLFEKDTTDAGFGGACIYSWQATMNIKNSIFRDNQSRNAAGLYLDGRELDSHVTIDGCVFENNNAVDYGGTAIYCNQMDYEIRNTQFKFNRAVSSGAAIYHSDTTTFVIENCLFEGNECSYAGAIANYGIDCRGTYKDCTFKGNKAINGGGAVSSGFKSDVTYDGCVFDQNTARFGGAIFTQNDTTRLTVNNCYFSENGAETNGGSILVNNNIAASITGSTFFANSGDTGGALQIDGDSLVTIDKCIFTDNIALTQAAAINVGSGYVNLTNTLMVRNLNLGSGAGGAISNNASNDLKSIVRATNCTFADNSATLGAGVAQWEDATGEAIFETLNCLFQNDGQDNYAIEDGAPAVVSLGGNQSSDLTMTDYLTGTKDINSVSSNFVNVNLNDYHLAAGPGVDGGVANGAPSDDLEGKAREGAPDRGCYEYGTSGIGSIGFKTLPLQINPNPVHDQATITLENNRTGAASIMIWNNNGQRIRSIQTEKAGDRFSQTIQVSDLPAGSYRVQVMVGTTLHEGQMHKL